MTTTVTQTPQTAQRLQLTDERRQLTAAVATWDCFETETYQASDIQSVSIRGEIVWIEFTNNQATAIDKETFKAKIEEFKAASQLNEEQVEIVEAAIDAPFQAEVNFQDAVASFYSDENRFVGTVRKDRLVWAALTETSFSYHRTAKQAVQSLATCTFEEWQEAKAGMEGIRYYGQGYWKHPSGKGRVNTAGLLSYLHLSKSDRQIAIIEQLIPLSEDC